MNEYLYTCTPFRSFQGTFDNMFFPRLISHTWHTGAHLWSVDAQGEWSIVSREVQPLGILCFRPILMANGFWEAAFFLETFCFWVGDVKCK